MTAFSLLLVLLAGGLAGVLVHFCRNANVIPTTREGGLAALAQVSDWAEWMAGIQTAALGGMALLVFDKDYAAVRALAGTPRFFALAAFCYLGAALFCSAWVLSSLPSLVIRLHAVIVPLSSASGALRARRAVVGANGQHSLSGNFDVYEQPLFGWLGDKHFCTLGYLLALKHWLWSLGLLAMAIFVVSQLFFPPVSAVAGTPAACVLAGPSQGVRTEPKYRAAPGASPGSVVRIIQMEDVRQQAVSL